jgi:hypothetical protein
MRMGRYYPRRRSDRANRRRAGRTAASPAGRRSRLRRRGVPGRWRCPAADDPTRRSATTRSVTRREPHRTLRSLRKRKLDGLAQDAQAAISGLQAQVKVAQNAVDTLNDIKAAVSEAASVLSAAAAIASGNFMGAESQVVALGNAIVSTMRGVGAGLTRHPDIRAVV